MNEKPGQGIPAGVGAEAPLVDDPDAEGADEADEVPGDVGDASPKTDVPDEDEPEEPPKG